jgi:hypothetical protein
MWTGGVSSEQGAAAGARRPPAAVTEPCSSRHLARTRPGKCRHPARTRFCVASATLLHNSGVECGEGGEARVR